MSYINIVLILIVSVFGIDNALICAHTNDTHSETEESYDKRVKDFTSQDGININSMQTIFVPSEILKKHTTAVNIITAAMAWGHAGPTSWSKYSTNGKNNIHYVYSKFIKCVEVIYFVDPLFTINDPSFYINDPPIMEKIIFPIHSEEEHEATESFANFIQPSCLTIFVLIIMFLI